MEAELKLVNETSEYHIFPVMTGLFYRTGSDIQPYNTPRLGELRQVNIAVSVETASGEVGFSEPYTRIVREPEGSASSTPVSCQFM